MVAADAGAERGDERADLGRGEHLVETGALDIENLPAERQNRLVLAVPCLFGGAAGGIAFDDEELGVGGIAFLAFGELARQARHVESAFPACQLAGFAGGFAGGRRLDDLGDNGPGILGMFLEPAAQNLAEQALDDGADFGGDELVLRLRGEFRIGNLHGKHAGQSLARVIARQGELLLAGDASRIRVIVHDAGQGCAETRQMRAAVTLGNVVGEAEHGLVIAVVPPQCAFESDAVALGPHSNGLTNHRGLGAVKIADEGRDAAIITQLDLLGLHAATVGEDNGDAAVEKRQLAQTVFERGEVKLGLGEGLGRGQEGHLGASAPLGRLELGQGCIGIPIGEAHGILAALAENPELQPLRQGIDDGDADAVEAARNLVGVLVEFAAGMQLGHDDFSGRNALGWMDVGRNAAAVVTDGDGAIGVEDDDDAVAIASQSLVDGIVDDLIDHVVKAGTIIGVADIHAGPLANGVEALQHLDRIRPRRRHSPVSVLRQPCSSYRRQSAVLDGIEDAYDHPCRRTGTGRSR